MAAYAAGSFIGPGLAVAATGGGSKVSANERVNVAFVGVGNRGADNLRSTIATGMCNVAALCDVDFEGRHALPALAANQEADPPARADKLEGVEITPKAPRFTDFRQMFDKVGDQIDAVVITTPDHTHFPAAMLAMSLGKHVYVEKPLAHTFGQVERLMDLATRSGVVTQMGNQGHSSANRTQFEAWTKSGVIKDVTRIVAHMNKGRRWHGWGESVEAYPSEPLPPAMDWEGWTGPSPMNTFSERLHPGNWRCWFDYGSG
ncbi:MAG: Gfo/Idh/MocA family oxidoreductase, partial [Planctomycetota bacterium]